ncbi:MAG: cytochrome c [Acidobacteriota bacterium]
MQLAKRIIALALFSLLALVLVTPADDKPAATSGKDLFKQNCRVCHAKDSPNGEYSPMTLIQDQWKKFFTVKFAATHKDVMLPGQNKKLLEALTPEQIKLIQKYCVDHAADSEQPQTCSS